MGLRPTHTDESPFLAPIDCKGFMRDFRRSVITFHAKVLARHRKLRLGAMSSSKTLHPVLIS